MGTELRRLDCTSIDTTLVSLGRLVGQEAIKLRELLGKFNYTPELGVRLPYGEAAFRAISGGVASENFVPDEVVWFHATRVPPSTDFISTGLLPLKDCLVGITSTVQKIVDDLGGPTRNGSDGYAFSYGFKLNSLDRQGPNAFLLRDAAVHPSPTHCTFHDAPEIVKDLAQELGGGREAEILKAYKELCAPCIVKFVSRKQRSRVCTFAAAYLYAHLIGDDEPSSHGTYFDGGGRAVPPSDILEIEWL